MKIPMLDLARIHKPLEEELTTAFQRVLGANAFIMGTELSRFEQACADYLGVKHALGVSSGSDALLLALMALEIGPGDEVICPSYTFFATAGAISRLGARPVFVDIDPESYNWNLQQVYAAKTERTRAVVPVHLFGRCADMDGLRAWADEHQIAVIEDAAQAIGAQSRGKMAGTMGHFGCFSFFPSKNLGALGDGGLLVSNDDEWAEKARILRTHGARPKYYHAKVGGNFRLDALQAAFLEIKLKHLDAYTRSRQELAAFYQQKISALGLTEDLRPAPTQLTDRHVCNQFILRLPSEALRNEIQQALTQASIGCAIYYPVPLHLQACFADLGYCEGDLPECERAAKTTLAIPIFPGMLAEEQEQVLAVIAKVIKNAKLSL